MKRLIKLLGDALLVCFIVLIGISLIIVFQSKNNPNEVPNVLGFKPMTVLTGSMRPLLEPGDMIVAKKVIPEEASVGDVITYKKDGSTLVTHRVIEIEYEQGKPFFRTQGDANNSADSNLVSGDQLVGRLAFTIPYGGYVGDYVKTTQGFIMLVLLPIILIVAGELKVIVRELSKPKPKDEQKDGMEV